MINILFTTACRYQSFDDMDELQEYLRLHKDALKINISETTEFIGLVKLGENIDILPNCKIYNNVFIDNNCTLGKNSIIGDNCILMKNTLLEGDLVINDNIILGGHSVIKENTHLVKNLLIKSPHGYITTTGSLDKNHSTYGNFSASCTPLNIITHNSYQKRIEGYRKNNCSLEMILEYEKHFKTICNFYDYVVEKENQSIH